MEINAKQILENVDLCIYELSHLTPDTVDMGKHKVIRWDWINNTRSYAFRISAVYDYLSIFDWWPETLSLHQLKDMRKFLKEAIKLGFTGYVCFKVGATGCANGMWAYKNTSDRGYSPDGPALYKSFTPEYNYWGINPTGDEWVPDRDNFDSLKTIKDLEKFIAERNIKNEDQ